MTFKLSTREEYFDAAHHLPGHSGVCAQTHGHTWTVQIHIERSGKIPSSGMFIDFAKLHDILLSVVAHYDHKNINMMITDDKRLQNPTAENLSQEIHEYVARRLRRLLVLRGTMLFITLKEGQGGTVTCRKKI